MTSAGGESAFIEVRDLVIRYGTYLAVDRVSFAVGRGEHLTLLGPSGCGKTTTLRAIAGLEQPFSGEILIGGQPVYSSSLGINLPPERRNLSMMFQSYAIWPHMTVAQNVGYGLRVRKFPREQIERRVREALAMVRLEAFADRPASRLSGGQQQRVALARSLAFEPTALLLDEPLSNLDAKLRGEMRIELDELQRRIGLTSISVTHDQEEALATSDRIIVMNGGVIEQSGTPDEIYNVPRTRFVADFVGAANILSGEFDGAAPDGKPKFRTTAGSTVEVGCPANADSRHLSIRTVYPELSHARPEARANVWEGRIAGRIFLGDSVRYHVEWESGELVVVKPPRERFAVGDTVWLTIDPSYCVPVA
jgi:iron(III) transport system ATP-binding protein